MKKNIRALTLIELLLGIVLLTMVVSTIFMVNTTFNKVITKNIRQSMLYQQTTIAMEHIIKGIQAANYLQVPSSTELILAKTSAGITRESKYFLDNSSKDLRFAKDASNLNSYEVLLKNIKSFDGFKVAGVEETEPGRFRAARIILQATDPRNPTSPASFLQSLAGCRVSLTTPPVKLADSTGGLKAYYDTIQAAIDAAASGDEIRCMGVTASFGGTFNENINISDKSISLMGSYDENFNIQNFLLTPTTIDAGQLGRAISCNFVALGNLAVNNFKIVNGKFFGPGAGIYVDAQGSCDIVISNNTITGNRAENGHGGGVYVLGTGNSTCNIINNIITKNYAVVNDFGGGGIYVNSQGNSVFTIANNRIEENEAKLGGGVYSVLAGNNSTVTISNNRINNNTVQSLLGGGGINVEGGNYCRINNNNIEDNKALNPAAWSNRGGGIYVKNMLSCDIENNTINRNLGGRLAGGIYISLIDTCRIISNTLNENYLDSSMWNNAGAGMFTNDIEDLLIANNHIEKNEAYSGGGGGIYVNDWGNNPGIITLRNNLIIRNHAEGGVQGPGSGGGVYFCMYDESDVYFINNTVADNRSSTTIQAGKVGSGVTVDSWITYTQKNCILKNNTPSDYYEYSTPITVTYSNMHCNVIPNVHVGIGNIDKAPNFVDSTNGDYTLQYNASLPPSDYPCVDTGDPLAVYYELSYQPSVPPQPTDLAAPPAKGTIKSDMGAYGGPGAATPIGNYVLTDDLSTVNIREDKIGTY